MNQLDFTKISKALQTSYQAVSNGESDQEVKQKIELAHNEYLHALSHATSVDYDFIYTHNKLN